MTIGSTYNAPADTASLASAQPASAWSGRFPGPPDLCFNYRKLVEQGPVAQATRTHQRIAIIGAGISGLTAAYELRRCGFTDITLIEQSRRIGGRHLTLKGHGEHGSTPFEMGAMRMPFFNRTGEPPQAGQSLMAYYSQLFDLRLSDFPNPGTPWVKSTGIYLREGALGQGERPELLIWKNPEGSSPPPDPALRTVYEKWHAFAGRMTTCVAAAYGSAQWPALWAAMVDRYQHLSFRDLVSLAVLPELDPARPGDFGGLGLSAQESAIFYSIGIGDGSWGAFYDVCALYPLRTAIFGFSSHLQLVHGRVDEQGRPRSAPYLNQPVRDSRGVKFQSPAYLGLAALDECLMFMSPEPDQPSLYEHLTARNNGLLTDSPVTALTKQADGTIKVDYQWHASHPDKQSRESLEVDAVIVTVPSWIMETRMRITGFSEAMLPPSVVNAYKTAHWETSCKVYAPLKKSFLDQQAVIPPILITDTVIHDVYAYRYNGNYAYDCILLSYTWEDDATKLASFSDRELVDKCITELDRLLLRCSNVGTAISPYIDVEGAQVQRWITDRNALGCAKLYRAGTYGDAVSLLQYNREYAGLSGLYLAGESFSVDAGWTEPALRGAIDAVLNISAHTDAVWPNNFSLEDYPHYVTVA